MGQPSKSRGSFFSLGQVTGVTPLVRGFGRPWLNLGRLLRIMPISSLTAMPRGSGAMRTGTPEERFAEEYRISGMTAARLSVLQDKLTNRATLFAVLAVLTWTYSICFLKNEISTGIHLVGIAQNIYVILFPLALTVFALRDAIHAYQICNLALVTLPEWLSRIFSGLRGKSGGNPPKLPPGNINVKSILIFAFSTAGLAVLWPHILLAQAVSAGAGGPLDVGQASTTLSGAYGTLAKLGSTDLSGQWLARLFPSLSGGSNNDQLSGLLSSFNSILLDAGCGLAFWQGSIGVIFAAQRGGFEGTNIHAVISPLRALLGAGALSPVIGGYCMMQMLSLQILGGGYWMADQLNTALLSETFNAAEAAPASSSIPVSGMDDLINNALSAETCYAWYIANSADEAQQGMAQATSYYGLGEALIGNLPTSVLTTGKFATATDLPWSSTPAADGTNAYTYDLGECGTISVGSAGNANSNALVAFTGGTEFDKSRNSQFQQYMASLWSSGLPSALASIFTPNGGALIGQTPTPVPTAKTLSADYQQVVSASTTYLQALQTDGKTLTSSGLTSYAAGLNGTGAKLGWVSAGALYSAVSQMYSRTTTGIDGSIPSLTVTSLEGLSADDTAMIQKSYDQESSFMSSAVLPTEPTFSASGGNMGAVEPTAGAAFNEAADAQRVLNEPTAGLLYRLDNTLLLDPSNPMASVVSEGFFMMHSGEEIFAALGLIKAASAVPLVGKLVSTAASSAPGVGGLASLGGSFAGKAASIGVTLGEILIFVGAFEAFVIPMLFYIAWLFQIVNCIAFAAEFVLAAPLAAYQFMRVNGTEPIGQEQRQFFLIAFMQGFLRPSLLIFGLVISSYVFSSIAAVLNQTFNLAVAAVQGSSIVGPIGIITYVLMLVFVQWQLCVRSIALIGTVPDAVADLVGGGSARFSGADQQALGVTGAVMPQMKGVTGGVIGLALGTVGRTAQAAAPSKSGAEND